MNLLLDTHALLWWAFDARELSRRARGLLADRANILFVSPASAWEIATKYRLGRIPEVAPLMHDMSGWFEGAGLEELAIHVDHAERAGSFAVRHRDPFDRMIAAQSLVERIPVLGRDAALRDFGVELVW